MLPAVRALLNPAVRRDDEFRGLFSADEYRAVNGFYDSQPSLAPTPLLNYPRLSASLEIGGLMIKDESSRFGLQAFKSLGARYAMERLGRHTLKGGVVCATAGNHGRAVARAAAAMDITCTVFVPAISAEADDVERRIREHRIAGMRADGAYVVDVAGTYEEAVALADARARTHGSVVVSDTGWPGYEQIPRDIMAGYTRLFTEASQQWDRPPDVVLVQGGVGGLVCAAASWFAFTAGCARPYLIACEPDGAACLLESARAGSPIQLSSVRTFMAGLRCATPSTAAWPAIRDGIDAFVAIPDSFASLAMSRLSAPAGDPLIDAGPSGACGVGALLALHDDPLLRPVYDACGLGQSMRVLAVVTEGK
jgi:diaminopropionate ammonia-lyase